MKQSEKMVVFALGAIFHAARIAGAAAGAAQNGETFTFVDDVGEADHALQEAREFYESAARLGYAPDMPEDDDTPPPPATSTQ